jgi:hypothetical protein
MRVGISSNFTVHQHIYPSRLHQASLLSPVCRAWTLVPKVDHASGSFVVCCLLSACQSLQTLALRAFLLPSADVGRRHSSRSLTGPLVVAACRRSKLRPSLLSGEEGIIMLRGSDIYRWGHHHSQAFESHSS